MLAKRDGARDALAAYAPHHPKAKRTLGLKVVDNVIYSLVNNSAVFVMSVFATYLTEHGWPKPFSGKALGAKRQWLGEQFQKRGQRVDRFFIDKLHWEPGFAQGMRMVTFSFLDGTFIAPFVKVLEDRREKMAMAIDTALGTKPKDESVYEAEPKQSWGSVITGRLLVSAVVVPTAFALGKLKTPWGIPNEVLFTKPGMKVGSYIEQQMPQVKQGIQRVFGKVDMPFLFKTTFFEFFYTGLCTLGLYNVSRAIARKHPKHEKHPHGEAAPHALPQPYPAPAAQPGAEAPLPASNALTAEAAGGPPTHDPAEEGKPTAQEKAEKGPSTLPVEMPPAALKDVLSDTSKETSDAVKDAPKDTSKDTLTDAPKGSPRDAITLAPRGSEGKPVETPLAKITAASMPERLTPHHAPAHAEAMA